MGFTRPPLSSTQSFDRFILKTPCRVDAPQLPVGSCNTRSPGTARLSSARPTEWPRADPSMQQRDPESAAVCRLWDQDLGPSTAAPRGAALGDGCLCARAACCSLHSTCRALPACQACSRLTAHKSPKSPLQKPLGAGPFVPRLAFTPPPRS